MSERPGDVLDEAAKLFDALLKRVGGGGWSDEAGRDEPAGDVWDRATAAGPEHGHSEHGHSEHGPHIATGAPECRDCPICRAIAMRREGGGDVGRHLREAGRSLLAAALDVAAAFDRTRPPAARENRPPEASRRPGAGTSDRSGRPEPGEPWSAATGGGPIDIG
ncbi:hypothetical protein E1293_30925 [Actinomadura darangshiensis]|uniref:Uncharacterized protein n=1 Tax=Actinomadura darangshiensis TaxID=705336 RepID=A0A4R5AP70_9ACTN|nr:hypothetical protein [Actinomadura darangshiensis]TDD73570.1 hypothetical protein E1293_30925 [Actinomadura darangshiensis]